jgi:hypothetical protein
VTYDELLALARRFEGQTLTTVTGKGFRVGVYLDCPFFTPESSGAGQSDGRAAAQRFVDRCAGAGDHDLRWSCFAQLLTSDVEARPPSSWKPFRFP